MKRERWQIKDFNKRAFCLTKILAVPATTIPFPQLRHININVLIYNDSREIASSINVPFVTQKLQHCLQNTSELSYNQYMSLTRHT